MEKKNLRSASAPAVIGPYSQAVKYGNLIFLSGQIPIDPSTGNITADTIESQTHQVLKNIKNFLEDNRLSLKHVIKTTVFVNNIDFQKSMKYILNILPKIFQRAHWWKFRVFRKMR